LFIFPYLSFHSIWNSIVLNPPLYPPFIFLILSVVLFFCLFSFFICTSHIYSCGRPFYFCLFFGSSHGVCHFFDSLLLFPPLFFLCPLAHVQFVLFFPDIIDAGVPSHGIFSGALKPAQGLGTTFVFRELVTTFLGCLSPFACVFGYLIASMQILCCFPFFFL